MRSEMGTAKKRQKANYSARAKIRETNCRTRKHIATHYERLFRGRRGREKKRKLRWRMTPDDAAAWAAANPGKPLEMVPNSGEERHVGRPYVAWGQVVQLRR